MKSTTGRGVKNWPSSPPEGAAEESLEGKPLDVVTGLREIETLELLHDPAEGALGDFEPIGFREEIIGLVVVLRQIEQASWTSGSFGMRSAARRSR